MLRLLRIQRVLVQYGLDEIIVQTHFLRPLRFLFYLLPRSRDRAAPIGVRIRLALQDLGPIFVKFGQAVSTRRDLLPADIADELAKLQDQVPPFPGEAARAEVERALGRKVEDLFASFELAPLASASVAQVHAARLKFAPAVEGGVAPGLDVIVKVLRPGVESMIRRDVDLMHMIARYVE